MAGLSQLDRGAGSTVLKGKLYQSHYLRAQVIVIV